MERKSLMTIVSVVFGLILLLGGGAYFAFNYYGNITSPEVQEENTTVQNNENEKPEPTVSEGAKNIPLPLGYETLDRSRSTYSPEQDAKQTKELNDRLATIREAPTSVWAWIELGGIKYGFKDFRGAELAWIHATKLAPAHTPAHANLAELYWHQLKDFPKAEASMKAVLTIDQTYVAMYRNLSDLYRYDYTAKAGLADDILKDGIAKLPTEYDLLAHLAYYYMDMKDWSNAVIYLEKLASVRTGDSQITDDLAQARKMLAGQ
jgi:predicted Zn-dependent protease